MLRAEPMCSVYPNPGPNEARVVAASLSPRGVQSRILRMERSTKTLARIEQKLDRLITVADAKLSGVQALGAAICSGASLDDTSGTMVAEVEAIFVTVTMMRAKSV